MIVLDTDVVIDCLRQYFPALLWLETLGETEIILPGYVLMELIQGCNNKQELRQLQNFVIEFKLFWPGPEICDAALEIFAEYHLSHNLGLLDALIGQTAVSLKCPLYTFNCKHYKIIPNLELIQPYTK